MMMGSKYIAGEAFGGTDKTFEDFTFDVVNQSTYTSMTGKNEQERNAAAHMLSLIKNLSLIHI